MRYRDPLSNSRRELRIGVGSHRLVVDLGELAKFLEGYARISGPEIIGGDAPVSVEICAAGIAG